MTSGEAGLDLHHERGGVRGHVRITRTARRRGVVHLLDCWPQVARQIKSAGHIALFLDFDGTLTRLRPLPEDVPPLNQRTRGLLQRLASRPRLEVWVISGRRLSDLRSRLRVRAIHPLGLHGWEGRGVPPLHRERGVVQRAKQQLRARLAKMARIWLEDKKLGLAVHFRGALPAEVRAARLSVRGVLEQFKPQLRLLEGKKVWELFPTTVGGKGLAVRRLLMRRRRSPLPIFVGDDSTDEAAFAAMPRGITVHVGGRRSTQARFYLRNPGEVLTFLERLEAEIA